MESLGGKIRRAETATRYQSIAAVLSVADHPSGRGVPDYIEALTGNQ